MPTLLLLATLLAASGAQAECTRATPDAIATAERAAVDAEHKADQANSVAVRSGNPGASARADTARRAAVTARKRANDLACKPPPAAQATARLASP